MDTCDEDRVLLAKDDPFAPPAAAHSLLHHYGLNTPVRWRRLKRGYVNAVWLLQATNHGYVVRRRHHSLRDQTLIQAQHALIQHLQRASFPAPALVPTLSGRTWLEIDQDVYEVLDYIQGQPCCTSDPDQVRTAARTLAHYHATVRGFDHPSLHRSPERYGLRAIERIVEGLSEEWQGRMCPRVKQLWQRVLEHAADLCDRLPVYKDLPQLVMHGDYFCDNIIVRAGQIVGVVDYDLAQWGYRALEVAEALVYFARETEKRFKHIVYSGYLDLDKVRFFLQAYTSRLALREDEIDALADLIRTIWLCASLAPPLGRTLCLENASHVLPEVLALLGWSKSFASLIRDRSKFVWQTAC